MSARFGQAVRRLRQQRGWSVEKLASLMAEAGCPINRQALNRLETWSSRYVTLDEAVALAAIFGTTVERLTAATCGECGAPLVAPAGDQLE